MKITTAEKISIGGEQDNSSDEGDFPIPDASKCQSSASSPTPDSSSVPVLPCSVEHRQSEKEGNDSQKKNGKPISPLEWKKKGNGFFGREEWERALHAYNSGLTALLAHRPTFREEIDSDNGWNTTSTSISATPAIESTSRSSLGVASPTNPLEVALRSNMAFVLLKLQRYDRAEEECKLMLSISPFNSKALYRRACAREGLYFSLNKNKQIGPETTSANSRNNHTSIIKETKDLMKLLKDAIHDLERALIYIEKDRCKEEQQQRSSSYSGDSSDNARNGSNKNSNFTIKKQCQRSLDRLQKEYNRQKKQHLKNDENARAVSTNKNNPIPPHRTLQSQQKRDVLRLLLARHKNGQVLQGEAFFLLEWNWWVRWCRYINFFDIATNDTKTGADSRTSDDDRMVERTRHLLNYFPKGATPPQSFRKDPSDNKDGNSSDEEDDDDNVSFIAPGCIDNTELLVSSGDVFSRQWYAPFPAPNNGIDGKHTGKSDSVLLSLKPNLIRGYHYEILPREIYNALRAWYGEITPSLCRRITADGDLMIYPFKSNKLTISNLESQRCNACRAPGASSRCKQCMIVQYCDRACQKSHWRFHQPYCRPRKVGKQTEGNQPLPLAQISFPSEGDRVGLNNLGNTCFMNSALQSLSHATPLTRYFLSNGFKSDLNTSNPLGTGGKLALAYETFLKDVWMKQGIMSTSPTSLKRAIALFAPRFAGYQQHDAQEFLAYLLDGIHEDLNRVRRATYVEMADVNDGQNMRIAAAKAWDAHKRRNDSLVMDTFYGQFQSTCVCPRCDKVSVSFDTFNHVSLEIPSNRTTWDTMVIPVLVHFADGNRRPIRYGVTVRLQGFVFDLKNAVANLSQIPGNKLVLTDVYENRIYKLFDDKQNLSMINPNEDTIVAYEVTPYSIKGSMHMIVSHSLVVEGSSKNENQENQSMTGDNENTIEYNDVNADYMEREAIGLPFMTSIDANSSTCNDLWELVCSAVRRIVESTVNVTVENAIGGMSDDSLDVVNNCRLEDFLNVHVVDAEGRPRCIFKKTDDDTLTNILPNRSEEFLSIILGEGCAEFFLFLTLVWNSPITYDEKTNIIIDPNRFLDFDNHPTLVKAIREQQSANVSTAEQGVTLRQCFQSFSKPERLDIDNMWYCSKCKQHVQALKTMKMWRLPNILVIHLKRFEFKNSLRRDKLSTFVNFPLAGLDMNAHCAHFKSTEENSNFVKSNVPADYDLFAVVNHYGRLGFGHYTAFAMQWDETGISNIWHAFDDSTVRPVQPSEIQTSAAYILFYRRRVFH